MTAGTLPESWKEVALIGIIQEGDDTEIAYAALTEDIPALDWGDKDIEGRPTVSGGRIVKFIPMTDESITFKIFPVSALLDNAGTAEGAVQMYHPPATEDATQPIVIDNTIFRKKHGIIILWAETLPATAGALPAISKTAYRIQIINAYMTSYKPSYDDKDLSAEITFKWTPVGKFSGSNKREESTSGTAQLAAAITTATSF